MLAAALLFAALGLLAHGWWTKRSLAARIARAARGRSASRPRSTLGWALGIFVTYGATALVALALLGRPEALTDLPVELGEAARLVGIAPLPVDALVSVGWSLGAGFVLGALAVIVMARRGWLRFATMYRSPAVATTRAEAGPALLLAAAAGIGEELFFRLLIPLLTAMITGSGVAGCLLGWAAFTLAHRYQGALSMGAVAIVGAVLGWLYLATGLLWLAMLLHTVVDANALVLRPWLEKLGRHGADRRRGATGAPR
ncbi:CPBP family intramembrane glutamic endopeptidase [Sphingomonas mucosissima]|uniref:CAAX amino terminal protease self-immunity n=1 Tax=Sphingomonas mucosissima TaxID=370959 RepID=A0A245ZLF9_9SPHN|nr:CPBP family intramembrane glutamic endopeptidase [Sphingomonas mucosissima]OWK30586.1 CAAX amino terminal protease self- immunity [Sphingomonas mucosissima]